MLRSEVVIALADIASKGKYQVDPSGARHMNQVFDLIAQLVNELEADEATAAEEIEDGS